MIRHARSLRRPRALRADRRDFLAEAHGGVVAMHDAKPLERNRAWRPLARALPCRVVASEESPFRSRPLSWDDWRRRMEDSEWSPAFREAGAWALETLERELGAGWPQETREKFGAVPAEWPSLLPTSSPTRSCSSLPSASSSFAGSRAWETSAGHCVGSAGRCAAPPACPVGGCLAGSRCGLCARSRASHAWYQGTGRCADSRWRCGGQRRGRGGP